MWKTFDQLLYSVSIACALMASVLFADLGFSLLELKYLGISVLFLSVAIFGLLQWPQVMIPPKKSEPVTPQFFMDFPVAPQYSEPVPASWERPRV